MQLQIKPLSVNKAWQGRRFKTEDYKRYINEVFYMLKPLTIPEGKLELYIKWGFSSKASDVDNPVKCFVDVLQKRYNFDDKHIYKMVVEKEDVKKGCEFIEFEIKELKCTK